MWVLIHPRDIWELCVHLMAIPRGKKLVLGGLIGVFQTQPFCKINGYY